MPCAELAMFPLNNLARHGMSGGHPHAVTMWLARWGGVLTDVLTRTEAGMVMPFLPSGGFRAAARALRGCEVAGIVGRRDWVRGLEGALSLTGRRSLDHDEPQFVLDLVALTVPEGPKRIEALARAPVEIIKGWMLEYQMATLNTPADQAARRVEGSLAQFLALGSHVVLMDRDTALAMTGFNAQLPHIVQVGGDNVPPGLRGRGIARRAVALHLGQARAAGVLRATLFSASDMAARACRALGFRQTGDWMRLLLHDKEKVG